MASRRSEMDVDFLGVAMDLRASDASCQFVGAGETPYCQTGDFFGISIVPAVVSGRRWLSLFFEAYNPVPLVVFLEMLQGPGHLERNL